MDFGFDHVHFLVSDVRALTDYFDKVFGMKIIDPIAIKEILEDDSLRQMMRAGARGYVEKKYNPADIVRKYWEILEDVG